MQDNEKKPALRFKGFTDPWEQRKVGTLIEDYTEKTVTQNQYPVLTSSQQQGIVLQEDYFADRQVTTDNNVGYYVLPKGYFTYRSRSDTDVFVFNRNNIVDKGIISYYYPVFAPKSCDSNFLLRRLNHGIKKQLSMAAEGTGQKVLAHAKFKNMVVDVPSQSEQEKIGTILEELDTLITLHQRKYEKLVNIKKSMLDKMFPKNGASVPEIRFKGFTDPWEQRKLGDVADIVGGGTPSTNNPNYWDGDIDWYAPAEIAGQIYFDSSQRKITEQGYENSSAKMLPPGTVLFTSRAGIGKTAILSKKGCTNQGFQSIVPHNDELDSYFVFSRTDELKQYGELVGAGSTFVEVSGKQMAAMNLKMPTTIEEQQTIGRFFKRLDTLITLHQRKLEKLQNIKKSCLEKMFV